MATRRKPRREQNQEQSAYSARGEQSSFEDMNAEQRATMALQLHVMGYTYQQIAERCGYANHSGALKAVKRLRAKLPVLDARDATALQILRIERAILECMEWLEHKPRDDRMWAIDRLVPLLKRQAELMGLDVEKGQGDAAQMLIVGVPQTVVDAI